jgi:cellulose synthase/poly-beta-1,6-N-acetylglucosamine synthase-like glycosyltransferase
MMQWLFIGTVIALSFAYLWLLRFFEKGWQRLPTFEIGAHTRPTTTISVLIPARDEATHIDACLRGMLAQRYPPALFEVIVIDDYSSDDTPRIVESFAGAGIRLLHAHDNPSAAKAHAHKKLALAWGAAQARGELIVTTDADCLAPPNWLRAIALFFETLQPACIAAPVLFHEEKGTLQRFQALDFLGMMLITGGAIGQGMPYLANGANLAFQRAVFEEIGGYEGIDHIASGDDLFLLHKISAVKGIHAIAFLKNRDAAVRTSPIPNWRAFWRQRLRWAAKARHYSDWRFTLVPALVFLFCAAIAASFITIFIWGWPAAALFLGLLALKAGADYRMLRIAAQFFEREKLMRSFWPSQFLHLQYILLVGALSVFKRRHEWKGRKVK